MIRIHTAGIPLTECMILIVTPLMTGLKIRTELKIFHLWEHFGEELMKKKILQILGVGFILVGLLSVVEMFASKDKELTDDELFKLCANGGCEIDREGDLMDSQRLFEQINTDSYTQGRQPDEMGDIYRKATLGATDN